MDASEGMTEAFRTQQQQHVAELVWERDELLSQMDELRARVSLVSSFQLFVPVFACLTVVFALI